MQSENDPLRDRLLGQIPSPSDVEQHRERVTKAIEESQKRNRRERIAVTAFWIFCVAGATIRLWFSADNGQFPRGAFLACILFIWGGVELIKHYINSCRIDLLKEIKQLQLQVFELERSVREKTP